ncbi:MULTISPECIES: carboxymuconolactone decarboxylase family protein [unclassified Mycolicibacterium]|uniref:carboxymuconolactone decarboxylase family protein n=1 Tax=unclassified Mycolicibacterium TaxID=2636767 RepID=UPI002ED7A170
MSEPNDHLGGRLPLADPAEFDAAQHELFAKMSSTVVPWATELGFRSITDDGRFIGPFNPALFNPALTAAAGQLLVGEREHTSLSPRVREIIILTVGAAWQSEYEMYAHTAAAKAAGLPDDAIRVLINGGIPESLSPEEKIAAALTRQLSTSHRVDKHLYQKAENTFGTKGLTDIAMLVGIYHAVSITLNLFEIPAPC